MKTIVLACALALLGGGARAEEGGHEGPKGGPAAGMKARLGLDDAQAGKVQQAFEAHKAALEPLRRQMRDATTTLRDQLKDKAPDEAIKQTLERLDTAQKLMHAERDKLKSALSSILTPTQQAKMLVGMRGGTPMGGTGRQGRGPGARPGRPTKDRHDDGRESGEEEGGGGEDKGPKKGP